MPKARAQKAPEVPAQDEGRPLLVNRDVLEGISTKVLMQLRTEISLELDRRKQHGM